MIKQIKINHSGFPEKFLLTNGCRFDICTHEQEREVFEGWSGHWAWFDEPPPRYSYIGTRRGLVDHGGRFWMTMTPISEPWIYDEIILKDQDQIKVIYMDTRDNPYLNANEIQSFESSLTPEEIEARIHGKFLHLTGLVYKDIKPETHFKTLDLLDENSIFHKMKKQWYFVLDPHDRRPHCGIWGFINPLQKKYIAYEMFMEGTISDLSAYIKSFEQFHKIPSSAVIRIGDPNKMETSTAVTGLRLKQEFAKYGLYFITKIDDDITRGHLAVKETLSWNKMKPLDEFNSPALYFSESVPKAKEMFRKYGYQEWRSSSKEQKNPRETPKDLNKDFPDCVRYWIMSKPIYYQENDSTPASYLNRTRTGYF